MHEIDFHGKINKKHSRILGSRVRKLTLIPKDSRRVGRIYIIGIDVRVGKGRYRDTLIVTFSPRFQLHNLSQYRVKLFFFFLQTKEDGVLDFYLLNIYSGTIVSEMFCYNFS